MNINRLASAISRGKWLIEPRTAMIERARAVKFLKSDFEGLEPEHEIEKPIAINKISGGLFEWSNESSFTLAEVGSVAIIPICGTIMKYDYCGSPGTDTMGCWLREAMAAPNIDSIILLINSGGGSVEGTGEFADLVKSSTKTVFAFCDGLMASAAYWIGCSANEVWASHETTEFGSIGTAVCFMDDTEAMEQMGYKMHYVNADTSPDKNQDAIEAMAGDYTRLKENIINPTNEIFMGAVKENRPDVSAQCLTGNVYLAERSIELGLIDGICTLEEVIEKSLNYKKMAIDTKENEKQVRKSTSLLSQITALFAKHEEPEKEEKKAEEDDMEEKKAKKSKKADDMEETEEKSAKKKGKKAGEESDDPEDKDKEEDDDDDESDEDEIEVNGKTINMKNHAAVKAAFGEITAIANERTEMLLQAQTLIEENVAQLSKNAEEVKKEIKSTFTITGSKRSDKTPTGNAVNTKPMPDVLNTKEGTKADSLLKKALQEQGLLK